jgi:hypothetical protein
VDRPAKTGWASIHEQQRGNAAQGARANHLAQMLARRDRAPS